MSGLQYRIVETPTGATASIFVPGRQPMVVQSSHPAFEEIVRAAKDGDAGLVAWLVNGGDAPASATDALLASRGRLGARPVATCPACSMPVSVSPSQVDHARLTCPFCSHEWNEFVVPDRIGAISSWKGLHYDGANLRSPSQTSYIWRPGVAGVAQCTRTTHRDEDPPVDGCMCGLYSGKTRAHQIKLGYVHNVNGVLAELMLSGRVVVATNGFRAQYGRIARLIVPDESATPEVADALRRQWEPVGVPVTTEPLFQIANRAKWCPACGHPAPDDPRVLECPSCSTYLERG